MEIIKSFRHAARGLWHVLSGEPNARVHLVVAAGVVAIGMVLPLAAGEMAAILGAVILVFLAEVINTAIEKTLDLVDSRKNAQVARVKDMAAGAVMVTAVGAVIIGIVVFWPYLAEALWS